MIRREMTLVTEASPRMDHNAKRHLSNASIYNIMTIKKYSLRQQSGAGTHNKFCCAPFITADNHRWADATQPRILLRFIHPILSNLLRLIKLFRFKLVVLATLYDSIVIGYQSLLTSLRVLAKYKLKQKSIIS